MINNPHDAFMKAMLSDIGRARQFLEEFLPPVLLERLDLSGLKAEKADFVVPQLKEYFTDAVFCARLKDTDEEKECLVSILIEHKSFIDKYTPFQILQYLAEGYRVQLANKEPLRPIVPLLYYHGGETWNLKSIPELFGAEYGEILDYVPRFETVFADMLSMSDEEIEQVATSGSVRHC
jgi:predicted transposase/invertase (TIGR01784 family)